MNKVACIESFAKKKVLTHSYSYTVDIVGRLHCNIFQKKLLLNSVGMRIKLVQNKNSFALFSLYSRCQLLHHNNESCTAREKDQNSSCRVSGICGSLGKGNAKYPVKHIEC